ncbi:hypothetical protein GMA12_11645 [Kocuria sediminis]|uniref:Uncharacterized protein n=1 Tax=Kocuria sediminis TaxID=1038857 RepID=A0A6N8GS72_9MICC|nr:hypothetical protein [Kocuria sediminis]MUN63785.1 hypothetical protein [Kocuria sediminis]
MTVAASSDHTTPEDRPTPGAPEEHLAAALATPTRTPGSRLGPQDAFPEDLTALDMAALQVLHSRITRQLDHDYRTDPDGPHCCTLDRCQELDAELNTRDAA